MTGQDQMVGGGAMPACLVAPIDAGVGKDFHLRWRCTKRCPPTAFDAEIEMTIQDTNQTADEVLVEPLASAEAGTGEGATEATQPTGDPTVTGESEADTGESEAEPTQLVALLEDARAKADSHWDQLLRTRAEMENLQRRQARELENAHKFALEGFARELLQVRDSLELGQEAAHTEGANLDKLREGTALTLKLMADTMAKFGIEPVDPKGQPFNPEFHQAMTMVQRDDVPPNTVVGVVQRGYLLNGRLMRPAMVMVSRKA